MPNELRFLLALVAWVAILLPIAAFVDRRRERRRLRVLTTRPPGERVVDEDDVAILVANNHWEEDEA